MSTAKIELKDEVNCKIHGLDTSTRRKLNDKFSFILPHAYHVPAFKLGRWDGKVSFFTFGAQTYIPLLEEIVPILLDAGYQIDIEDHRIKYQFNLPQIEVDHFADKRWPKGHPVEGEPVVLRDYQQQVINRFMANPMAVQEIATGAGKTLITAALSNLVEIAFSQAEQAVMNKLRTGHPGGRTIVIVPNKGLVTQTEEDYINLGLDVGVYFGDRKDIGKTHTVCTWQSLEVMQKRYKNGDSELSLDEFADGVVAIIVDEVHQAKADVLKKLLTGPFANVPLRWGLTGTIPKEEHAAMGIRASLGNVVGDLAASTLQDRGILSNCQIDVLQLIDNVAYNNYQSELTYLTTDKKRLDYISEVLLNISDSGNTLVLVDRVKAGEELVERLGDRAVLVSGKMKNDDRRDHYKEISSSDNKVIVATYGVAAVGINIPRIFNLVLLEPGKSFVRVIQSIGRGLRKADDKDFVNVYDFCSTAKFSKRHLTSRKKFYKDAGYPYKVIKVDWQASRSIGEKLKERLNANINK